MQRKINIPSVNPREVAQLWGHTATRSDDVCHGST